MEEQMPHLARRHTSIINPQFKAAGDAKDTGSHCSFFQQNYDQGEALCQEAPEEGPCGCSQSTGSAPGRRSSMIENR
ncbi:hypothetical protein NDU88_008138 [Pleurodeles waltl]|uniref:Uncharacterized protein n=1 Tax=Pleurodeles waltl TaxID=8319 RepID=A0AAV7QP22_PLEWA|nr:hypothetical protein NDU88_008138 [Pleurodeles waltl]